MKPKRYRIKLNANRKTHKTQHHKLSLKEQYTLISKMEKLIAAGIPIIKTFEIIQNQSPQKIARHIIEISNNLSYGKPLSQSMSMCEPIVTQLIFIAEATGDLPPLLHEITSYLFKKINTRKKFISIMIYPTLTLITTLMTILLLSQFVIPKFADLYSDLGGSLPPLTRYVIAFADHIDLVLTTIFLVLAAFWALYRLTKIKNLIRKKIECIILKTPLLYTLFFKQELIKFTRTLAISQKAGIHLTHALSITLTQISLNIIRNAIQETRQKVDNGLTLSYSLKQQKIFPTLLIQMIAIGEEAGKLDEMLDSITSIYEADIALVAERVQQLIGPILITLLSLVVGIVVTALYLPIFNLGAIT